jgi:predicted nucleic acid-binding protein
MTGPFFVDTNVLVYADDARDPRKQTVARGLLRRLLTERSGKLSLQVLQEFYAAATGKLGVEAVDARRRIEIFSSMDVVRLDVDDVLGAIDLHRLHQLSIWDALVVRAALVAGCRTLYTEDLQHGRRFEALQIVDPFREAEAPAPSETG